jgi:hypothetical protein
MAAAVLISPALARQVYAQDTAATPAAAPTAQDKECDDLYNQFVDLWATKKDQAAAFPIGKQYMEKCGTRADKFTEYVKGRVEKYEAATLRFNFEKEISKGANGIPADVYKYGKQLLAQKADDQSVVTALGFYGAQAYQKGDKGYKADAVTYSKQAIQMIESGGVPMGGTPPKEKWDPFTSKDEALAWLNYGLGVVAVGENATSDAVGYFYKSSQIPSSVTKAYNIYYLGAAYDASEVAKAYDAYKKFDGQDVSPESTAAQNVWYQTMDRAMEFYARAINAAGADAQGQQIKDKAMTALTELYKIRHNNETKGMTEYIASVGNKPLPDPKSPLPPLPPPTPATPPPTASAPAGAGTAEAPVGKGTAGPKAPLSGGAVAPATKTAAPAGGTGKPAGAKTPTRGTRNSH